MASPLECGDLASLIVSDIADLFSDRIGGVTGLLDVTLAPLIQWCHHCRRHPSLVTLELRSWLCEFLHSSLINLRITVASSGSVSGLSFALGGVVSPCCHRKFNVLGSPPSKVSHFLFSCLRGGELIHVHQCANVGRIIHSILRETSQFCHMNGPCTVPQTNILQNASFGTSPRYCSPNDSPPDGLRNP